MEFKPKMKKLIYLSMLAAALLTACGPKATPTVNPADVQATAFAAASTMVAQTQAAIPTATPFPPTETPSPTLPPTNTPPAPPTSSIPTLAIAPTQGANADNCGPLINMAEAGPKRPVLVQNQTEGSILLSLNLSKQADFGQCGAMTLNLAKGGSSLIEIPSGNWWAYAWITLKNSARTSSGSFYVQLANTDKQRLIVGLDTIVLKP